MVKPVEIPPGLSFENGPITPSPLGKSSMLQSCGKSTSRQFWSSKSGETASSFSVFENRQPSSKRRVRLVFSGATKAAWFKSCPVGGLFNELVHEVWSTAKIRKDNINFMVVWFSARGHSLFIFEVWLQYFLPDFVAIRGHMKAVLQKNFGFWLSIFTQHGLPNIGIFDTLIFGGKF